MISLEKKILRRELVLLLKKPCYIKSENKRKFKIRIRKQRGKKRAREKERERKRGIQRKRDLMLIFVNVGPCFYFYSNSFLFNLLHIFFSYNLFHYTFF